MPCLCNVWLSQLGIALCTPKANVTKWTITGDKCFWMVVLPSV